MSMLAERKKKVKWTLNPCGNLWMKDSNKFGQKMLEKMGWTPGKGLGAEEQGITEAIKLKSNSTQKGLGYSRSSNKVWIEHQDQFNLLLSELNNSQENVDSLKPITSLEEKSKNCRTRVHYKKFTRGKDLSRCTPNDLVSILGYIPKDFTKSVNNITSCAVKSEIHIKSETSIFVNENINKRKFKNFSSIENINVKCSLEENGNVENNENKKTKKKKKCQPVPDVIGDEENKKGGENKEHEINLDRNVSNIATDLKNYRKKEKSKKLMKTSEKSFEEKVRDRNINKNETYLKKKRCRQNK